MKGGFGDIAEGSADFAKDTGKEVVSGFPIVVVYALGVPAAAFGLIRLSTFLFSLGS